MELKNVKCCHVLANGSMLGKKISFESLRKISYFILKVHAKNYENLQKSERMLGTMDDLTLNLINELDNRKYLLEADVITMKINLF